MQKKLYKTVPAQFPCCVVTDCPQESKCLRALGYKMTKEEGAETLRIVNPGQCTADEACRHFRSNTPERYARGFIGMQQNMLPGQYYRFSNTLISHFSRTQFYERRRGAVALSPKEQKVVLKALHKAGVTEDLPFDAYEETYSWYD